MNDQCLSQWKKQLHSWRLFSLAAKFGFRIFQSPCNLTGTSTAALPKCLSNFRAIRSLYQPISRFRGFTRSYGKTSVRLVNRGPCTSKYAPHSLTMRARYGVSYVSVSLTTLLLSCFWKYYDWNDIDQRYVNKDLPESVTYVRSLFVIDQVSLVRSKGSCDMLVRN